MLDKKVKDLLEKALEERQDLFLINLTISSDNQIKIVIDGDNGVLVEDCIFISRAIEHNLDREEEDFSLEVASFGAASPLEHKRQYKKNIGRTLNIITSQNEFEGKLTQANKNEVVLEWKAREPKPIGKGKVTVQKQKKILYDDIVKSKVMIKF